MSTFKAFLAFIEAAHAEKPLGTQFRITLASRLFDALVQDAQTLREADGTFKLSDGGRVIQVFTPHGEVVVGRIGPLFERSGE